MEGCVCVCVGGGGGGEGSVGRINATYSTTDALKAIAP